MKSVLQELLFLLKSVVLHYRKLLKSVTSYAISQNKLGHRYTIHSALNKLLSVPDYHIRQGCVVSNSQQVKQIDNVLYMPIYYIMFVDAGGEEGEEVNF